MTVSTRNRRSKFLFDLSPLRDGLSINGAPAAVSSGKLITGTFARGGTPNTAYEMDAFGYFAAPGYKQPRFTHRYNSSTGLIEPAGLLLEGARSPTDLGSCSFGDSTYWNNGASYVLASAISCFRGQTATKHTCPASSGTRYKSMGVFVSGQTDCAAIIVEQGSAATCNVGIYDGTATASLARAYLTWATMGVATVGTPAGSGVIQLAGTGPNGGKLALLWVTATGTGSGTGADGHTRTMDMQVTASGDSAYAYLHHAQFTANATAPSSPIVNVGSALTRSPDQLSFDFNIKPRALSVYVKFTELGTVAWDNLRIFQITDADANLNIFRVASFGGHYYAEWDDGAGATASSSSVATGPSRGDTVEALATIASTGSVQFSQALNGGSTSIGTAGSTGSLPSAWGSGGQVKLVIGAKWPASLTGFTAIQCLRVSAGVQSLGYMAAG